MSTRTSAATTEVHVDDDPFMALLRRLLAAPAPSAYEGHVAEVVRDELRALGLSPATDAAGNVYLWLEGDAPEAGAVVLAAHMDEVGAIVQGIEPGGELRVDRSGRVAAKKFGEGPVEILGDRERVIGVLGFGTGHTSVPGAADDEMGWKSARVITGLSPAALAEAGVRPGSPFTPPAWRRGPVIFGDADDPLVGAWTFDDRAGVAMLLGLVRRLCERGVRPARPTCIAFTIHEEGGCHGAKYLAGQLQPEVFIAVDGTPMLPNTDVRLDGGPCVWTRDQIATSDPRLVRAVQAVADQARQPLQMAYLDAPCSDASIVHNVGAAPRVVTFGHVRANSHGFEVAHRRCFAQTEAILWQLVQHPLE